MGSAVKTSNEDAMKRYGMVIGVKPDKIDEYKRLHAAVWPDVLATLSRNGVQNFSIFLKEPENLLFGYFEYHGQNYSEAAQRISECPKTREWLAVTDPCQEPMAHRAPGEWWAMMPSVFHMD